MMQVIGKVADRAAIPTARMIWDEIAYQAGVMDIRGSVAVYPSGEIVATARAAKQMRDHLRLHRNDYIKAVA